jgi:hypothetical protein
MRNTNYIIAYQVIGKYNQVIKSGKMRVKNKETSIHAQIDLEEFLKRKISGFVRLEVLKCEEDVVGHIFGDIFGDIFRK